MLTFADRINGEAHGFGGIPDTVKKACLMQALGTTLDSIAIGVVIVSDQGRILHANQAARRMFDAQSPIVSLGGCLSALRAELTKELRGAIQMVHANRSDIGSAGIGVPLVDKEMAVATAHVLPLARAELPAIAGDEAIAAVFITPASGVSSPLNISTMARIFGLTHAEGRLLEHLIAGASLTEAAAALGIAEGTARTHRNHIFMKTGVSRRADLLVLISRLIPPIRRAH